MNDPASSSVAAVTLRLCYRHADVPATQVCARCRRTVCAGCASVGPQLQTMCTPCIQADALAQRRTIAVASVAAVALVSGLLFWATSRPTPVTYGEHGPAIERAAARVEHAPCDGQSSLDLAIVLNKARDFPRVVRVVEAFDKACQPVPRLWWESYSARRELQDFAGAEADATRLIADNPDDSDFHWWRGRVRRDGGNIDGAAVDFEKAVELAGTDAFFSAIDLADIRVRQNRACDAVPILATLVRNHEKSAKQAHLDTRLFRLMHDTPCPDALTALPEEGKVAAVCAALPQALQFATPRTAGFDFSLQNLWLARTRPIATGPAVACEAMVEQIDVRGSILDGSLLKSWHSRLACAGRPSVTATTLHVSALHAQEQLARKLVDAAIRDGCGRR
jgi:hypothetical protein